MHKLLEQSYLVLDTTRLEYSIFTLSLQFKDRKYSKKQNEKRGEEPQFW